MLQAIKKLFGGGKKAATQPVAAQTARHSNHTAPADPSAATIAADIMTLDCRNMNCPMPIIQVASKVKTMQTGDKITVLATDPAFRADIEAWVRKSGNLLLSFEDGPQQKAVVQKQQA